jgi:uncharacterized membrane protein YoaK (UPF0700 family)
MFRHQGKNRTFIHNLRLATLLSFVAGIVNITGVLAKTLTTNVTGHFALQRKSSNRIILQQLHFLFYYLLLSGAFTSNFSRMDCNKTS